MGRQLRRTAFVSAALLAFASGAAAGPLAGRWDATVVVNTATSDVRDILAVKGRGGKTSSVSDSAHWVSRLP